jgi:hypothetical protein
MSRREIDGNKTGMKSDKYRNSRFEYERDEERRRGVSSHSSNTLGGITAENRGHRGDEYRETNPFETGELKNWNHRQGWDSYYGQRTFREGRQGGAILDSDISHRGKGPRGYKRSDQSIYEDVCEMLSLHPELDATEVEVELKEGIVYLRGKVHSRKSKKMAELEIEGISGVIDVQNYLTIVKTKDKQAELH